MTQMERRLYLIQELLKEQPRYEGMEIPEAVSYTHLSTLNAICSNHGISKGLLYHNFAGKDGLYLACVSYCFSDVTEYLLEYNTVLSVDNRYGIEPCVSVKK